LPAVELSTLPPELLESWAASAPPGFQFAVKAPARVASELASGKGAARAFGAFLDLAEKLGESLGPILIQVPATRSADRRALASFLAGVPDACAWPSTSSTAPGTRTPPCGSSPRGRPRWC